MPKPKFYLEPRTLPSGEQANEQAINMYYSIGGGKRLQYYTGVRTEVKYFRPECNKSNSIKPIKSIAPYSEQNNNRLADIANRAVTIASEAKGDNHTVRYVREQLDLIFKPKEIEPEFKHSFISFFEKVIEDSKTGNRLIPKGKNAGARYSRNAIKNYGNALSAIKRYMQYFSIDTLQFEDIDKAFYERFRSFCYDIEQKEKSTFGALIKDIKTVMGESKTPDFNPDDFIIPTYEADTIYLNIEQINKIEALDLTDYSKSHPYLKDNKPALINYAVLEKVKDIFLIGCFTGLRYSDLNTLDLKSINGNFIDSIKQTKTTSRVTIPIMNRLKPVFAKYPDGLPTMSNQKFNDYIKMVAKLAGLNEQITIKNTKGNINNETTGPLFEFVSSHILRRSFSTNMFKAGISPMLIMGTTGHQRESSFLKYIRASSSDKAKLFSDALIKSGF
jgi:hypothetical protein